MSDTYTEAKPDHKFFLDRASRRTDVEREAHFEHWWTKQEPYRAAVIANGDTEWTADLDDRRRLFMRRYERPEPPTTVPIKTLAEIRGHNDR